MRASIKLLLLASLGSSLAFFNACSSESNGGAGGAGASSGGSDCQRVCDRMENLDCADEDCVETCETELSKCDAEFRDVVSCAADAQTFYCANGEFSGEGCSSEEGAFTECLFSGNAGGAGGGGGGGPGPGGAGPGPGGGGPGTDCEKLCDKAATAGCEPTDCVNQCSTALPKCDAEFDAFNTCAANTGTITCDGNGKADVAGCDAQEQTFTECLLGGGDSCYEGQGECDPTVAGSCGAAQTCDFGNTGYTCYPDGTVGANDPCASADDCGDNTTCQDPGSGSTICVAFCCDDTDCVAGGTCTPAGNAPSGDPVSFCIP